MGDYPELRSLDPAVIDDATQQAAVRAVLRRYEDGTDTAGQCLDALQMLGLVDAGEGVVSRRSVAAAGRKRRRQAARERARQDRDGAA